MDQRRKISDYFIDVLFKPVADSNRWTFTAVVHIPQEHAIA
jgi:hypothetical protein